MKEILRSEIAPLMFDEVVNLTSEHVLNNHILLCRTPAVYVILTQSLLNLTFPL